MIEINVTIRMILITIITAVTVVLPAILVIIVIINRDRNLSMMIRMEMILIGNNSCHNYNKADRNSNINSNDINNDYDKIFNGNNDTHLSSGF